MNLSQIAKAITKTKKNHSILIYGPPKTGKSRLVGTAAKIPEVKRIFWFDLENGMETLLHMDLTDEEMQKITVYSLPDTKQNPVAIETMLKAFSKNTVSICNEHGKVECKEKECAAPENQTIFSLKDCTHNDLIVIDSGSQLGDSAISAICLGKGDLFKPGWDEYAIVGKWLSDILSVIQQAAHTNFVVITHELITEGEDGKERTYPLIGSKNFSIRAGKFFGTVAYTHIKLNKHVAGSSATYRSDTITGSRVNATLEKTSPGQAGPSMKQILIDGGILS